MTIINKHLIPTKVILFFIWGGYGCLWPFITVHLKQLGLSIEEAAIINLVPPFISLLGPPVIAVLIRKSNHPKAVLGIFLILSAITFTSLLFVPPASRHPQREPDVLFECDYQGGRVHVERCNSDCIIPSHSPLPSSLNLRHCSYICDENVVGVEGGLGVGVPSKPYICTELGNITQCQVYNMSGNAFDLTLSVPYMELIETSDSCIYPFVSVGNDSHTTPLVHCRIAEPGCAVHCIGVMNVQMAPSISTQESGADILPDDVELIDINKVHPLHLHQCQRIDGYPLMTFISYLILRTIAEFFMYSSLYLLESTITNTMWEFGGSYSHQLIWGLLPIGLICPVLGLIMDSFSGVMPRYDYAPMFFIFDIMMVISVILLIFLPIKIYSCFNKLGSYIKQILSSGEILTFFIMMLLLGTIFGFVETFYYWFLYDKGANHLFMGLTITVGVFPAIPILIFSDTIIRRCGHANFLIASFFAYSIRLLGYSVIDDFRYFFPFEITKVLSHFVMWAAAVTYCERLGPKVVSTTIIGTVGFLHNNIGRGLGTLVGGYIMSFYGEINAFRVTAVYAGIIGLIYMAAYHFYLKDRQAPISIEACQNGHYTPMETYSNQEQQLSRKPMLE